MAKLLTQHKKHLTVIAKSTAKVAEIEGLFQQFGVSLAGPKPVAKAVKPAKKAKGRRKRGVFAETAEQFVLGLLKGGKSLGTADLNKAWKKACRGGKADNALTKLTKTKQIKREKVKGVQGSHYRLA